MEKYSINTTIFSIPMVKYFISNDRWNRNLPKKRMGLIVTVYRQNQIIKRGTKIDGEKKYGF